VSGQARPDERVMIGQDLRVQAVAQAPQGRRRTLDVGEQEREGLHTARVEDRPGFDLFGRTGGGFAPQTILSPLTDGR
jgi:hypothetical protein